MPVRGDLVEDSVESLAAHMAGHDAVVFSAGAGGDREKVTAVDEKGAKKAADAAASAASNGLFWSQCSWTPGAAMISRRGL